MNSTYKSNLKYCLDQALAQLDKPKSIWVNFYLALENFSSIVQGPGRISTLPAQTRFSPLPKSNITKIHYPRQNQHQYSFIFIYYTITLLL